MFMVPTMNVLYDLAQRQAGYFTTAQALDAGVSRRTLSGRAQRGDLERASYGIYRLRQYPAHRFEDVVVACLWAGASSAASHETALAVHGISDAMPTRIHITVPQPFRGQQSGVIVHRAPMSEEDVEIVEDVPVTTIARTLSDIAESSDPTLVEQAVADAIRHGSLSRRQLRRLVRDRPALAPVVVDLLADNE